MIPAFSGPQDTSSLLAYLNTLILEITSEAFFAPPSALIGLTAKNGSAATAMRSDGAPALDQSIAPTWTGLHTWAQGPSNPAIVVTGDVSSTDAPAIFVKRNGNAGGGLSIYNANDATFSSPFAIATTAGAMRTMFDASGNYYSNGALFVTGGFHGTMDVTTGAVTISSFGIGTLPAPLQVTAFSAFIADQADTLVLQSIAGPSRLLQGVDPSGNYIWKVDGVDAHMSWGVGGTLASMDTGISRLAAGVLVVGNGAANDASGTVQADMVVGTSYVSSANVVDIAQTGPYLTLRASQLQLLGRTSGTGLIIDNSGASFFTGAATTASAANAFLDSGNSNNLLRSTSSLRYKKVARRLTIEDALPILDLSPFRYLSLAPADDPEREFDGLGAEEVAAVLPQFVNFDEQGRPDGVQYERLAAVALLTVVKDQQARIASLEARLH